MTWTSSPPPPSSPLPGEAGHLLMSVYNYLGVDGQHRGKRGGGRGGLKRGVELVHAALYHLAQAYMTPHDIM